MVGECHKEPPSEDEPFTCIRITMRAYGTVKQAPESFHPCDI